MLDNLNDETIKTRFLAKVDKISLAPCWLWTASTRTSDGGQLYGKFWLNGKDESAHRVSYELFIGAIPNKMTLDHLCRRTLCVNPNHIQPTTQRENTLRGIGPSAINARKTHCIRGHELKPRGLDKRWNTPRRYCPICNNRHRRLTE